MITETGIIKRALRVLLVEDMDDDALLVERALHKGGFNPEIVRVENADDLRKALQDGEWDIVLSDFSLPQFNGLQSLSIVQEHDRDLPFVLVSGAVGEESAVAIMRSGARDYVMKDKLARLAPVVEREIKEAALHREHKQANEEKIALEKQLRQTQKLEAIGTLAGGIAHDFNNILSAILGYSDLALEDLQEWHPARKKIEEVLKAGLRARDLVKQILTFSRKAEEHFSPLEISLITKETMKLLRASLPTTIAIDQHIEPDCGCILGDPTQIHQVLLNLCTNAAQAMEGMNGKLQISMEPVTLDGTDSEKTFSVKPGDYVLLTVKDSGPGIEPAILERIFEPYFTTKEQGKGTGLGLAVVLGIVQSHGGMIRVKSRPGEGTAFYVYFPKISEFALECEATTPRELPTGAEHILLVDDEDVLVELGRIILESLGYKVTSCQESTKALMMVRENPQDFDLVITDQTMPYMPGTELSKKLLEIRPDLPIILCTGFSSLVDEDVAKEIGIRAFAMKPLDKEKMATMIRKVLQE